MQAAFDQFELNFKHVRELDALYDYLHNHLKLPNDLSDILRAEWVYSVSALDKLIHELVRIGMLESFQGHRVRTAKFNSFTVSVNTMASALSSSIPPPAYWFEQEIIERHKTLSFQAPEKIADALSFIWDEAHKWQQIASSMSMLPADLTTKLKTIVARRNQIVHEADWDLISGGKTTISKSEADDVVTFIYKLGETLFNSVK